jgi:hypothetical protein
VFSGYIQGNEIVPFIFYLRPIRNGKTHPAEYLKHFIYNLRDNMLFTDMYGFARQGNIDKLLRFDLPRLQSFFKVFISLRYFFFDLVCKLSGARLKTGLSG